MANRTVEEERVVVLTFDNSDFEKNTRQSMKTLDELDGRLKNSASSNGLKPLKHSAASFNLDNVGRAIDSINNRFSMMGVIGTTALANISNSAVNFGKKLITAIPRQIYEGGTRRAKNFEQANFQLRGLLGTGAKAEKQLNDIMQAANEAVDGTAYGLDSAARTASQLAASGVDTYDKMKVALTGVSGLAAMTGRSYDDVGMIFAKVAGQGRIMGAELNQIASGGVNAAQAIQKFVNNNKDLRISLLKLAKQSNIASRFKGIAEGAKYTEKQIRDLVSAGVIDFNIFAGAMNDAFGEHATKANETYAGSLDNLKSALSRIGEKTATSRMHNMTLIFNELRMLVNHINERLRPLQFGLIKISTALTRKLVAPLDKLNKALTLDKKRAAGLKEYIGEMDEFLKNQSKTPEEYAKSLEKSSKKIGIFGKSIGVLAAAFKTVGNLIGGFFNIIITIASIIRSILAPAFNFILTPVSKISHSFLQLSQRFNNFTKTVRQNSDSIGGKISGFASRAGARILDFTKRIKESEKANRLYSASSTILNKAWNGIKNTLSKLRDYIKNIDGIDSLKTNFIQFAGSLKTLLGSGFEKFVQLMERIASSGTIKDVFSAIGTAFLNLGKGLAGGVSKIAKAIPSLGKFFNIFDRFKGGKKSGIGSAKEEVDLFATSVSKLNSVANRGGAWSFIDRIREAINSRIDNKGIGATLKGIIKEISGIDYSEASKTGLNFSKAFALITGALSGRSMAKSISRGTTAIAGSITLGIGTVSKAIGGAIDNLGTSFSKMGVMFTDVSKTLTTYRNKIRIGNFKAIAIAVALIAGAIVALTLIDWEEGKKAVIAVGVIFAGIVALTVLASKMKLDGKGLEQAGIGIAAMASSMLMISLAAGKLAKMSWGDLGKAGLALTAIVGLMYLMTKATEKLGNGTGGSFAKLGIALLELVVAVRLLALMKWETVLSGAAKLIVLIGLLALASKMAGGEGIGKGGGFVGFAMAINMLVPSIITLSVLPFEKSLKAAFTISLVMTALAVAARIAGKANKGLGTLALMGGTILALAVGLKILGSLDTGKMLAAATALSGVVLAISVASFLAGESLKGVLVLSLLFASIAGVLFVIKALKLEDAMKAMASLGIFAVAMGAALLALSLVSAVALQALIGVGVMIGAITMIGVFATALGALFNTKFGSALQKSLEKGIEIIGLIGEFIGSFVSGIGVGLTNGLPKIGENLKLFGEQIKPFMDMMSGINAESAKSMKLIVDMLLELATADLINKLTGGSMDVLNDFAEELSTFVETYKEFADKAAEIDPESIKAATRIAEACKSFTKLAEAIPGVGVLSIFTGFKSLTGFGVDISNFIGEIKTACASLVNKKGNLVITKDQLVQIKQIANAGKAFAEMAEAMPNTGGIKEAFVGMKDMQGLGADIGGFVDSVKEACESVTDSEVINKDNLSKLKIIAKAGTIFAEVAETLPEKSMWDVLKDKLGGKNAKTSLSSLGKQMGSFIDAVKEILPKLEGLDEAKLGKLSTVSTVASNFANMANKLSETKSNTPGKMSVVGLAKQIKTFIEEIQGIEVDGLSDKVKSINDAITKLNKSAGTLKKTASTLAEKSGTAFSNALSKVGSKDAGAQFSKSILSGIKTSSFKEKGTSAGKKFVTGLTETKLGDVTEFGKKAAGKAKQTEEFYNAGKACGQGFADGLTAMQDTVASKGTTLGNLAYEAAKKAIKSKSPSKKFRQLGIWSGQGMVLGMESYQSTVYNSGYELGKEAYEGAIEALHGEAAQPVIRPVLDLTDVRSGAGALNGMMANASVTASMASASLSSRGRSTDKLIDEIGKMNSSLVEGTGDNISIGDITLDVNKLKDLATVDDFVDMLKRAKAFH